jgi:hypothetical protein
MGCALDIGLVHEVVAGHRSEQSERGGWGRHEDPKRAPLYKKLAQIWRRERAGILN